MITYPISSNFCKKFPCNVIRFTIFHLSEAATGGVQLEKVFLEISQNSQENNCGKVSFLRLRQLLLIFLVSSLEDFLLFLHFNRKIK